MHIVLVQVFALGWVTCEKHITTRHIASSSDVVYTTDETWCKHLYQHNMYIIHLFSIYMRQKRGILLEFILFLTNDVPTFKIVLYIKDCIMSCQNIHSHVSFINSYHYSNTHCLDMKFLAGSVIVNGTVPCNMKRTF